MTKPILSVVMPVFNGEKHIKEAIDSVLKQTFTDFELLIINDGSEDRSIETILSFHDPRIRLLHNDGNRGIPYSRNRGLMEAKGEFLCWTDCDDLNYPERFAKQIDFLKNNLDYGCCGTWIARFKDSKTYFIDKALKDWQELNASLLFKPASIPNPTAMVRLSKIKENGIKYNTNLPIGEDYDFIYSCSRKFKLSNIQEVLYKYRDSETSIMKSYETKEKRTMEIKKLIYKRILSPLNLEITPVQFNSHYLVCSDKMYDLYEDYTACCTWLETIRSANISEGIYNQNALQKVIADQFFFVAKKASKFGLRTVFFYINKSRKNGWHINITNLAKLTVRCLLKHDKFEFGKR